MNGYSARRRPSALLLLAALGLTLLTLVACKAKGASPASPTTAASPSAGNPTASPAATPSTAESPEGALLAAAVLLDEDLPEGLITAASSYSTNEQVADAAADPAARLDELNDLGRRLGYEVNFVAGADAPADQDVVAITTTASLYTSPDGATRSYEEDVQAAKDADWPASYPSMTQIEVDQLERPDLADAAFWLRVTGIQSQAEGGALYIEDFVVFRQATLRGFIRQVAVVDPQEGRDAVRQEVAALVERQVEHMNAALETA
jgi:hypothetical protein